uniref:Ionotropic glutamate receptor C-terminal domain-containing protein n=1 Tax=Anopheles farauti TaxID=69004 RepID=A0A182QB36_9DIPT
MALLPLLNYTGTFSARRERHFESSILAAIGMLCQQGISASSRSPNRIVIVSFMILTLLLYQYYTTFFVGYQLIVPRKSIYTLEQLIASEMTVAIEDVSYNHEFFRVKMRKTFTEREICELQQVQLYPQRTIQLPVTKGSPLRESFRLSLLRFKSIYMVLARDWSFDSTGRNSTQGMIGQLQAKLVDFSVTPFALTTERIPLADFTIEIAHGTFYTVFRHPKSLNKDNIFLHPFDTLMWTAVSAMFASVAFFLGLSIVCSRWRNQDRSYVDLFGEQVFLGTVGILSQQGFHDHPSGRGTNRLLLFVGMGFSLVILQFYSTFILGYQLITPPRTITSLERLVDSELKMSVENLSYHRDFFNRTKNPAALKLYQTKILPNKFAFVNLSFGVQLVKRGGYAFHCETSYGNTLLIEMLTEREICDLQKIQLYPQRRVHLPLVKGSPLRELFKMNLQLLKERGLIAYYHVRNYVPTPKCNKESTNHIEPILLTDVKFAFLLLAVGMAASVILMALEIVLERTRHRWINVPEGFVWLN